MVHLFRGTCEAIRAMHSYCPSRSTNLSSSHRPNGFVPSSSTLSPERRNAEQTVHSDDEDQDERFPQPEGDVDGGYSYDAASMPLVTKSNVAEGHIVFDGDEEAVETAGSSDRTDNAAIVPYAHRDLKPG